MRRECAFAHPQEKFAAYLRTEVPRCQLRMLVGHRVAREQALHTHLGTPPRCQGCLTKMGASKGSQEARKPWCGHWEAMTRLISRARVPSVCPVGSTDCHCLSSFFLRSWLPERSSVPRFGGAWAEPPKQSGTQCIVRASKESALRLSCLHEKARLQLCCRSRHAPIRGS
jgi:hypothetical protein